MCLNTDFNFIQDTPPHVKAAFSGEVTRTLLPTGTRLWKWTDYADLRPGPISPWWAPLEPDEACPQFDRMANLREIERQAEIRGGGARSALRHGLAILPEWNSMGRMLIVALRAPVYAFAGLAAMQQMNDLDGQPMTVYLAGGFGQLFVPNLNDTLLEKCEAGDELLRLGIANVAFYLKPFTTEQPRFDALQPKTRRLLKQLGLLTPEEEASEAKPALESAGNPPDA